jgi:hypothetical protein
VNDVAACSADDLIASLAPVVIHHVAPTGWRTATLTIVTSIAIHRTQRITAVNR